MGQIAIVCSGHMDISTKDTYGMRILFSSEVIQDVVREMGERISEDYKEREVRVIGALKGCFVFMADLVRHIRSPLEVDFIGVSSYGNGRDSSGVVKITKDFTESIEGQHVLLVEDIIDSGRTLDFLMENIQLRRPASVKIASLLVKNEKQRLSYPIDYRGLDIEDIFVVGYGMDFGGRYRNLDHIAVMPENDQPPLFR